MPWRAPDAVLLGAAMLAFAAAAAVAASGQPDGRLAPTVPGLGRALDVSRCAAAFDAREDGVCRLRHDPVPGLHAICPDHAARPLGTGR